MLARHGPMRRHPPKKLQLVRFSRSLFEDPALYLRHNGCVQAMQYSLESSIDSAVEKARFNLVATTVSRQSF